MGEGGTGERKRERERADLGGVRGKWSLRLPRALLQHMRVAAAPLG